MITPESLALGVTDYLAASRTAPTILGEGRQARMEGDFRDLASRAGISNNPDAVLRIVYILVADTNLDTYSALQLSRLAVQSMGFTPSEDYDPRYPAPEVPQDEAGPAAVAADPEPEERASGVSSFRDGFRDGLLAYFLVAAAIAVLAILVGFFYANRKPQDSAASGAPAASSSTTQAWGIEQQLRQQIYELRRDVDAMKAKQALDFHALAGRVDEIKKQAGASSRASARPATKTGVVIFSDGSRGRPRVDREVRVR